MNPRLADFMKCVKCGCHAEHPRQYLPAGSQVAMGSEVIRGECIIRRCQSCGFAFTEPCADAPGNVRPG